MSWGLGVGWFTYVGVGSFCESSDGQTRDSPHFYLLVAEIRPYTIYQTPCPVGQRRSTLLFDIVKVSLTVSVEGRRNPWNGVSVSGSNGCITLLTSVWESAGRS